LIIDPNSLVNARIQDSKIMGLIKGGQELDLVFDLLPQGKNIEVDSAVVTSGLSGLFPAGLLIGQIEKVISSEAQISQIAKVKPVVDFYKLDKVFVDYKMKNFNNSNFLLAIILQTTAISFNLVLILVYFWLFLKILKNMVGYYSNRIFYGFIFGIAFWNYKFKFGFIFLFN